MVWGQVAPVVQKNVALLGSDMRSLVRTPVACRLVETGRLRVGRVVPGPEEETATASEQGILPIRSWHRAVQCGNACGPVWNRMNISEYDGSLRKHLGKFRKEKNVTVDYGI
jgi:hypothetical protein